MAAQPNEADLPPLAGLALRAARAGAAAVAEVTAAGSLRVSTKSSHRDLVTAADAAAESAVVSLLRSERPDDAVLGEEHGELAGTSDVRWVVDPIDGTSNFVHGRRDWGVSVAAERAGEYVAGALVFPAHGVWVAAEGDVVVGSEGRPRVSGTTELSEALIGLGFPYQGDLRRAAVNMLEGLHPVVRDFRRVGSAVCDLYAVASGSLDATIGMFWKPWDEAGGAAVVTAAGGRCYRATTPRGLQLFVAGTPAVVDQLAEVIPTLDV